MKKSKIILIAIYIITATVVLYFAYGAVKNRYFTPVNNVETKNGEIQNQPSDQAVDADNQNPENIPIEENAPVADNAQQNVGKADCNNNCVRYKDNPDNFKYCQEFCGDIPIVQKNSEEDCVNLSGLEKDYCWRDLAVSKKDIDICDKIGDGKLQKVCRVRVTEEVLN